MAKGKSVGVCQCGSVYTLCVCLCLCARTLQMSPYGQDTHRIMLILLVSASGIDAFVRNQ